jgi:O-antigen/teichoic acid export membrane protein
MWAKALPEFSVCQRWRGGLTRVLQLSATVWVTIETIFAQLFWLSIFAIQAPILGPYAFGLITLIMVFVGAWEAVPGVAVIDALISIREIDARHFATATTVCTLISLVFGIVIFVFAAPLAMALGDRQLAPLMRAMSVLPLIHAFSIAPTAAALREMRFRSTAARTITSLLAGGLVGLASTFLGAGVWALVWQALVQRVVAAIVLWLAVPISLRFAISRRNLGEIAGFALPVIVARAMSWGSGQCPRLILGFYLGPSELGLFGLAMRLIDIVNQVAVAPKTMVARVDLRRFASDLEAFRAAVRRLVQQLSLISFPLGLGGAAVMPTLFRAWLDARWLGAVAPSQLMLLTVVPYMTFYVASGVLLARNRQNSEARISVVQGMTIVIAVATFGRFGLVATSAAIGLVLAATMPVPIAVMRRQCGLTLGDLLSPQTAPLAASCAMGLAVSLLRRPIEAALGSDQALFVLIAIGAVLYAGSIALLTPRRTVRVCRRLVEWIVERFERVVEKIMWSHKIRHRLRRVGIERLLYLYRHRDFVRSAVLYRRDGDTAKIVARLQQKNLVFSVTAGRTGTLFVQKLFSILPNVTSEHEPQPAFHTYLRRVQRHPGFAKIFLSQYKLPYIGGIDTPHYVELSHVFCKGFLEPLLGLGLTPNLILLRRNPRRVALSHLERYAVPDRTFYGLEFLLNPRESGTLPLPGWRRMTDYQLIFWYALEIERRQREYAHLVRSRGGIVCDVTATELNDLNCFLALAASLGILDPGTSRPTLAREHAAICRLSWNQTKEPGWHCAVDLDGEEEEVWHSVSPSDPDLRRWVEERYQTRLRVRDLVNNELQQS